MFTLDRVKEKVHAPLGEHGLSMEQYNLLRILRGAGTEGLRTNEAVSRMVSRSPNITRLVDKLEKRGWIKRASCPTDRRVVYLQIREAGIAILDELDLPIRASVKRTLRGLDTKELGELVRLLEKLSLPLVESEETPESRRET